LFVFFYATFFFHEIVKLREKFRIEHLNFELFHGCKALIMPKSSSKKAEKNADGDAGKLPWTEDMELCLLKLVLHYGAPLPHIEVDKKNPAKNGTPKYISKPADRWLSLTKDFFWLQMVDFLLLRSI
jgi:hypothetical protein